MLFINLSQSYSRFSKLDQRFKAFGHEIQSFILTNTSDDTGLVSLPTSGNVRVLRCSDTGNICDHFDYQSVYIFDKCGRFTFVIIYPWSSVRQPYVKAGLLSTIFDAPCGSCHINASEFDISKLIANETKSFKLTVLETGPFDDDEVSSTMNREVNTDDFKIPIKIYLPLEHAHPIDDANITYMKYNYVVLKNDDPNYHEHSDTDTIEVIQLNEVIDGFDTNETKWIFNSLNDSTVTYEGKKVHNDYVEVKQHNDIEISSLFDEPTTELIANSEDPDTEPMEDMRVNMEHLQKLIPWVRYKI